MSAVPVCGASLVIGLKAVVARGRDTGFGLTPGRRAVAMQRLWAVVFTAVIGMSVAVPTAYAQSTPNNPPSTPSYPGDFPDPAVVWDARTGSYWAYATQHGTTNVQVMSSPDLASWSTIGDALQTLPPWASPGHTWAPSVAEFGTTWVLWYTTRQASSNRQCLSVATASSPAGPFTDGSTAPDNCQLSDGGSIDANIFVDATTPYLLWKSDSNALRRPTHLWAARLLNGGTVVSSTWKVLLSEDAAWQYPAMEGPTMVASGGKYYLFYGAGNWDSTTAAIGYATCRKPLGPCRDRTTFGPLA
jgi:beta-xylosidase